MDGPRTLHLLGFLTKVEPLNDFQQTQFDMFDRPKPDIFSTPSKASQHHPQLRTEREIRLLRSSNELNEKLPSYLVTVDSLSNDNVSYDALSYVWGPPAKTQMIYCNDVEVGITENLHVALAAFQNSAAANPPL